MKFESMCDGDGNWIPVLLCDSCFQPIHDFKMGVVDWSEPKTGEEYEVGLSEILAYHKTCYREFPRADLGQFLTMELRHFWEAFFQSAQFQSYDRVQAQRTLAMLRRL